MSVSINAGVPTATEYDRGFKDGEASMRNRLAVSELRLSLLRETVEEACADMYAAKGHLQTANAAMRGRAALRALLAGFDADDKGEDVSDPDTWEPEEAPALPEGFAIEPPVEGSNMEPMCRFKGPHFCRKAGDCVRNGKCVYVRILSPEEVPNAE